MRVVIVHNRYRTTAPSGEDVAVENERRMLERRGVEVFFFERCNDELDASTLPAKMAMATNTIWSQRSRVELRKVLRHLRPDIVHVHNTFAAISPSIYGAATSERIAVVQTLHNFRFFCPSGLFLREGKPCEDCVDKGLLQAIRHRCYRGSITATTTLASMLQLHRVLGTYSRHIHKYIVLTEFARRKAMHAGISQQKLVVKPNFLPNPPAIGQGTGGYIIFVGRLFEGKGLQTLVRAWRQLPDIRLKIVGDGALRNQLETVARNDKANIEFIGRLDRASVLEAIRAAALMIVPSEWYEGFPMVIAESYACGTPVLASRIGSLEELVEEGVTGHKFSPNAPHELVETVRRAVASPALLQQMRTNSRAYFNARLVEEQNFAQLIDTYRGAIEERLGPRTR
jgi:glycosyltransferase involved in cell wall biosynthesis